MRVINKEMHLVLLEKSKIEAELSAYFSTSSRDLFPVETLEIHESISSTNDQVRLLPKAKIEEIQCCFAEHQTQGRGRFQRVWTSPFGVNLMFSARIRVAKDMTALAGLSLCVGLSVLHTLKSFGISEALCKWPNDIWVSGEKLGGILIEAYFEKEPHETQKIDNLKGTDLKISELKFTELKITELIIGIGLNINQLEGDPSVNRPWTSMRKITGNLQDRNQIAAELIKNLSFYLKKFMEKGFEGFQEEWVKNDYLQGKSLTLLLGNKEISGIARGVNLSGHLLLEHSDGVVQAYPAGEVSIKR